MDSMDNFHTPSIKAEPRWGREDAMDRPLGNEGYRSRRSPGKLSDGLPYRDSKSFSPHHLQYYIPLLHFHSAHLHQVLSSVKVSEHYSLP